MVGSNEVGRAVQPAQPPELLDPQWGVGAWIWDTNVFDKQTCRLWRSFEIPGSTPVARARLRITADNGYRLWLDGREIGRGSDWRNLTEYDLTWVLRPGPHVLAVEAFNDRLQAGLLAGLAIEFVDGNRIEIPTDSRWWIVPGEERSWERRRQPRPGWYPATVVGQFGSPPWTTRPYAIVEVPALQPLNVPFWKHDWFQFLLLATCGAAGVLCLNLMARLAWHRQADRLLHRERMRIARDLHDELGSGLTQLLLTAELARKDLPQTPALEPHLAQLSQRARLLAASLDEIVWAINSRRDTLRDFVNHTCKYAQTFLSQAGIRCRLDLPPDVPAVPFALPSRRNLFLAVKEALNNAVKHSGTPEVALSIRWNNTHVQVTVTDQGRGFDSSSTPQDRNGLHNLFQRMAEVGGSCSLQTAPGRGCTVVLCTPLQLGSSPILAPWRRFLQRAPAANTDLGPETRASRTEAATTPFP